MSNDNVVAFPGAAATAELNEQRAAIKSLVEAEKNVNPDDEMEQTIRQFINLLKERKADIRSFICALAIDEGEEGDTACHTLTSPIEPSEYALLLKMLESSFHRRLNGAPV